MNDEDEIEDDDEDEGDDDDEDGDDRDGYIWLMREEISIFYISVIYKVIAYWELPSCPQSKWF